MKVLIVRYIRNADNYFFDIFDAASAGLLKQAGHDVAVVERVLAEGFDEDDVLAGLYRFARDFAPDLIFLSYTPRADLPRSLREQTGARIAATGSSLLLAADIDFVLAEPDPLALVQLAQALEGSRPLSTVAALAWREGEETRRSDIPLHSVFDIFVKGRLDYGAFYRLGPGRPAEIRKHVAGDWGCPYRHAASASPPPEAMPAWVPAGGCTFCTRAAWDNRGWDLKGPVVGQQMDKVLEAFPDLAKLIVIDEHGLAHADGLADLAARRPLDGAELLLSGRLDHVARYRERLVAALEKLREKCSIRLYQFGIENLADSALQRYNKGLTYRDLAAGLKLMNELEHKHANLAIERSFGFILFDPWTTLDELRLNVERARSLGLDRYRGQAPFTTLRLVPEMRLFWQAQADGLLTGSVEDNPFGYSVHSGWRFREPAVAAVHRELHARRGEFAPWALLDDIIRHT